MKVYLAEDDIDDVAFFRRALLQACPGCSLDVSENGEEMLTNLTANAFLPDIIFLDLNMPGLNGIDCLAEVKKIATFAAIPVIILTTVIDHINIDKARRFGASLMVKKPRDFKELGKVIRYALTTNWSVPHADILYTTA